VIFILEAFTQKLICEVNTAKMIVQRKYRRVTNYSFCRIYLSQFATKDDFKENKQTTNKKAALVQLLLYLVPFILSLSLHLSLKQNLTLSISFILKFINLIQFQVYTKVSRLVQRTHVQGTYQP
jgi:hypothetical protein